MIVLIPTLPSVAGLTDEAPTIRVERMIGIMIIFSKRTNSEPNGAIHRTFSLKMIPRIAPMTRPMRIRYSRLKLKYQLSHPFFTGALFLSSI